MKIYSHSGIDEDIIKRKLKYTDDFGETTEFSVGYNEVLVVNMPYIGVNGNRTNAQGWLRDAPYYFKEMLSRNPEYFSQQNVDRIVQKRSPYCDNVFIEHFPEYEHFRGNKLIHHHIGRDGQAVSIPEDIHVGQGGVHLAEKQIGIDANALRFSDAVSDAVSMGNNFSWDDAEKYVVEYSSGSTCDAGSEGNLQTESETQIQNNVQIKTGKELLANGVRAIKHAATSPAGAKVIAFSLAVVTVGVAVRTPQGKMIITNVVKKISSSKLGKKIIGDVAKNTVKETLKEGGKQYRNETVKKGSKKIAKKVATEVTKKVTKEIITKPGDGTSKAPHVRSAHFRKLVSGKIIRVREAKIHSDMLLR